MPRTSAPSRLMDPTLVPFLKPRGVVLVGAATSPKKLGFGIARNLVSSQYAGAIHLVGQKGGELFGKPIYSDLAQVPDPVDLAILAVPSNAIADALRACAQRGICAAILVSAGFRESGAEGTILENECLEIARVDGIRLLGPNCIGIIDTHLPLDTTFLQPPIPDSGGISFISHSGAFCAAIIDWSRREGFGFAQIVSLGNQADITETDMLSVVAEDPHTRVITLYMEGVSDGHRFVEAARHVTQRKPVIALKVGRFEGAQKAAASHTGALAASDTAFDAAFRKVGIARAFSAEQMFDWARALENCPLPRGRNIAILTDAGGPGVIAADALEPHGLILATLGERTVAALAAYLPSAASLHNPVDMLASASPEDYARSLKLLLEDDAVDAALVVLPPPPMFAAESVADAIIPMIRESKKPVVMALMGSTLTESARTAFSRANISAYPFPERAASALGILASRADYLRGVVDRKGHIDDEAPTGALSSVASMSAEQVITAYGIPVAPLKLAANPKQAASFAQALGFPVVLKIASADIIHKSDIGGVLLNIQSSDDVLRGYAQIVSAVQTQQPSAVIDGIQIQRHIHDGQEIIIGTTCDTTFGALVMFGSGGIEAEGLNDVAFALAPLTETEASELMDRTWAGRRLNGFRHIAAGDKAAAQDALIRISWLAYQHPEIKELEINPLRVLDKGAIALDVRMVLY